MRWKCSTTRIGFGAAPPELVRGGGAGEGAGEIVETSAVCCSGSRSQPPRLAFLAEFNSWAPQPFPQMARIAEGPAPRSGRR